MLLFLWHQAYVAVTVHPETQALWVVGYLVHQKPEHGAVYLEAYAAHPQYQRRKVGTSVLRTFFDAMKGCHKVSVMVEGKNTGSRDLLEAMSSIWGRGWHLQYVTGDYVTYWMLEGKAKAKE